MADNLQKIIRYILLISIVLLGSFTITGSGGGGDDSDPEDTGENEPIETTTYDVSGYVQKGPFVSGSSVVIHELDSSLIRTDVTYETETTDDLGSFTLPDEVTSNYIEIVITGYYYDEVSGQVSSGTITLNAISDATTGENIYVNVLTLLESSRIRYLVQNEGVSFAEARSQAESEVLAIFNIDETGLLNFDRMDIASDGDSNAILLAVSAILQGSNSVTELSDLLLSMSHDIEEDGGLDDTDSIDEITDNSTALDLDTVRSNLEDRYESLGDSVTIPTFENYVDSDGDGILNEDDEWETVYQEDFEGDTLDTAIWTQSLSSPAPYSLTGDGELEIEGESGNGEDGAELDYNTAITGSYVKLTAKFRTTLNDPINDNIDMSIYLNGDPTTMNWYEFVVTSDPYEDTRDYMLYIKKGVNGEETLNMYESVGDTMPQISGGTTYILEAVNNNGELSLTLKDENGDAIKIFTVTDSSPLTGGYVGFGGDLNIKTEGSQSIFFDYVKIERSE